MNYVQPHFRNYNKKIVKTPKVYFSDSGLLCHLLGIHSIEVLVNHPLRGAIFENLVYTEMLKEQTNKGIDLQIWFWRDNHGTEIDFLLDMDSMLIAIEVKSGMNFHDNYLRDLKQYRKYNPDVDRMYLLYDGKIERMKDDIQIMNWRNW